MAKRTTLSLIIISGGNAESFWLCFLTITETLFGSNISMYGQQIFHHKSCFTGLNQSSVCTVFYLHYASGPNGSALTLITAELTEAT